MHQFRSGGRPGFGGMSLQPGVKLLLIANTAIFVLQTLIGGGRAGMVEPLTRLFAFVPQLAIFQFEIWRFVTYMFLHGGMFHLAFNMFALWMFGSPIEAQWGKRSFLIYYFVCGLGGAVTYGIFNLVGFQAYIPMIGASGAIFGILLAYGMVFPNAVILVMFIFPMRAKYAVILFGAIALMSSATDAAGGVAHLAHLGGMLTGFIFLRLTIPALGGRYRALGTGGLSGWWRRWKTKRRMRVVRPEDRSDHPGNGKPKDRTRIDEILDKISKEGLDSLTPEEQDILRRAGRK